MPSNQRGEVVRTLPGGNDTIARRRFRLGLPQRACKALWWSGRSGRQSNQTTDPQAEVLYPSALSLDHLHTITVGDEDTYVTVVGALANFPSYTPYIALKPEAFR